MNLAGSPTPDDAEQQLVDAVEFASIAAQHAPAGHAIFAAIRNAESVRDVVHDEPYAVSPDGVQAAIDRIYDAAATIRNDPDSPLPRTLWTLPTSLPPWGYIAAAGATALVAFFVFKGKGGGRRRASRRRR